MFYARLDGEIVTASGESSNLRRLGWQYKLRCPACGEPIYYASGHHQSPHFRHYQSTANLDCEEFHPSNSTYYPSSDQKTDTPPETRPEHRLPNFEKYAREWSLDFTIEAEIDRKTKRVCFFLRMVAKGFKDHEQVTVTSINGADRSVSLTVETKKIAMAIDPFQPFISVESKDVTLSEQIASFQHFFEKHRYFIISANHTLQADDTFNIGDVLALYDRQDSCILYELDEDLIKRILDKDGYILDFETSEVLLHLSAEF